MLRLRARLSNALAYLCALSLLPAYLSAQEPVRLLLDAGAGASAYEFAGGDEAIRGTSFVVAGHVSAAISPRVFAEFGITYFQYDVPAANETSRSIFPELTAQIVFPHQTWSPFLGFGGGWQQIVDHGGGTNGTVHGAIGIRGLLTRRWGVRMEVRGRLIAPTSAMADFTLSGVLILR